MSKLIFSSTTGNIVKASGGLKSDEDGYYKIRLGAIGVPNSSGILYEITDSVRNLFNSNSPLMQRLLKGYLRSEQGHPKKLPGMTDADYVRRILKIEETLICGHIKQIDVEEGLDGPGTVTIIGHVRPAGPYAKSLQDEFENSHSNTAFSIRSLVDQRIENGVIIRTIKTIVTWDFVDRPGIDTANKANSVGLECEDLLIIDKEDPKQIESTIAALEDLSMIGNENDKELAKELLDELSSCRTGNCVYKDWK